MSKKDKEKRRQNARRRIREQRCFFWEACREKFGLDDEDIRKAKCLGITPEKLISLPKTPAEKWKMPPKKRIESLYEKHAARQERKRRAKIRWERKKEKQ